MIIYVTRIFSLSAIFLMSSHASAQQADTYDFRLSLDSTLIANANIPKRVLEFREVIERSASANPQLLIQQARTAMSRAQSYQAGLDILPELSYGLLQKTVDGTAQGTGGELVDVDYRSYQNSVWFGYRLNIVSQIFRALSAREDLLGQKMNLLTAEQRALAVAVYRYDNLLVAATGLNTAQRSLRDHVQIMDITERRRVLGLSSDLDVARVRSRVGSLRDAASKARQIYTASSVGLAVWLDLPPEDIIIPSTHEMRPVVNWADTAAIPVNLSDQPKVAAAHFAMKSAGQLRNASLTDLLLPDLEARAVHTDIGKLRDDLTPRKDIIFQLSWSISAGDFATVSSARSRARKEYSAWQLTQEEAKATLISARLGLIDARERLIGAKNAHDAALAAQASALAAYENGLISIVDVFDAEDQLAKASLDLASAIADADSRWIDLRAGRGNLVEEALTPADSEER